MYLKATWFLFFCKSKWLLTSFAQSRSIRLPSKWSRNCVRQLHKKMTTGILSEWAKSSSYVHKRRVEPKVGGENFPYLKRLGDSKVKLFFSPESAGIAQQFCIESPTPNFNQLTFGFFFPSLYPSYCFIFLLFFLLSPPFSFLPLLWFQLCPPNFCWLEILALSYRYVTLRLLSLHSAFIFTFPTPLSHPHPVQLKFKRTPGIRESYLGVCGLCCG